MDFAFNDEQELLRSQAHDYLDRVCPTRRVRELMETEAGWNAAMYGEMAELGWTAIPFAEEDAGLGLGMVDMTVVLEELGRHVTPSPFHSTVCFAGMTVRASGDSPLRRELLAGIAGGSRRATVALLEASGRWDASGVQLRAERKGDAYLLSGEKLYVPDAQAADWMIVAARTEDGTHDGVTLLVVDRSAPGVEVTPVPAMDQTQRLHRVGFDHVEVDAAAVLGSPGHGFSVLRRGLDAALVAISAELCGVAERAMEMSVDYAKTRRQFGRPIGTYQAVSHKCADMLIQVESAKSLTYHAAWAHDAGVPEAPLAASMAKAYASDAARNVTALAIQVHGGIGFTWEHDAHLYFKRAKWGELTYGDARLHRERVAQLLEL
ncbi:MAG TPA: acyl-CoA dehydrogenase family protein [Candidatus Dormibacteraeota bacterium]